MLAELRKLTTSSLFRFTGAGPQGVITNVIAFVNDIKSGRPPSFPRNASPFLTDVKLQLAFFCKYEATNAEPLYGAAAAAKATTDGLGKHGCTLDDLELPITFSWLLAPQVAADVETARKKLMSGGTLDLSQAAAAAGKRGRGSSSSAASSSGGAPADKKKKTEIDACMSMFTGM